MIALERHMVLETAKLNQPINYKNVLSSKWKSENMLRLGKGYAFVSRGNESYGSL